MKSFLFKKSWKAFTVAAIAILCLFALVGCGKDKGLIAEGVSVSGIDVGGMTKAEAKKALSSHADFAEDIVLSFECEGISFTIPAQQLELSADIDKSVERAYAIGRGKDSKQNKKDIKEAEKKGAKLNMALSYDKDKLILVAGENLGDKITDPSPMTVEIGEDCLIITNALSGTIVDTEKAISDMEDELSDFKQDKAVTLVLTEYTPKNLTFEELKTKYVREAKDAVYTVEDGNHNIEPEVVGVEIDEAEAKKIFEENKNSKEPYKIPAKITRPEITASYLEDKYVNKIMAKYSTSFAGSSQGRCTNIALAASKINGYVLNPGQRFSYNAVVGPRTEAAGFKNAHVYVGTKVVDGIGGGICQVSSALYNAVVMADLKTVTRVNHSIPVNYVPMGRDATVSYGSIDYVFENNKSYPVSIKATIDGTMLTIAIVGTSEMDYSVEFQTRYISSIPYSETTVEDETLNEGETKIITNGSDGSIYESYRVYKRNGVEFDRKFESRSRYLPIAKEVAVGTKKEDEPPIEEPPFELPEVIPPEITPPDETEVPPELEPEVPGDLEDVIVHPETEAEEVPSEEEITE